MPANPPEFELRLNALERQNRRLRLALCALALPLAVLLGAGFHGRQSAAVSIPPSPEVQAQRFVLVDSSGHEKAVLGLGPNGPFLHFLGSDAGVTPLSVDGSGVVVRGSSGLAAALDAGGVELDASAGHAELKAQSLTMQPSSSSASVRLQVQQGAPSLVLQDAGGSLAAVGVHSFAASRSALARRTSAASIALVSSDHRILWSAPPGRR